MIGITNMALLIPAPKIFAGILDGLPVIVGESSGFDDLYLESNG